MNDLLFTALIIALTHCFFLYPTKQQKLNANLPLTINKTTQTEELITENGIELEEIKLMEIKKK